MLITDKETLESYFEDIITSKHALIININKEGQLERDNCWSSDLYLAYIRGNWYASRFDKNGKPMTNENNPQQLFIMGNRLYMEMKNQRKYEVATPKIPLSKDNHTFLLFCHGMQIGMVIADGSKSSNVLIEEFRATRNMWKLLLMSTIAMIRQYDSKAADEIEEFWGLPEEDLVVDPKKVAKVSVFDDEKTSYGP